MVDIEFKTYSLPSFWASYLVNGDVESLSQYDMGQIDAWLEEAGVFASSADIGDDVGFCWRHDASGFVEACECSHYTFTANK